jgi:hypothetical protein
MATDAKCPFTGGTRGKKNRDWWPDRKRPANTPAREPRDDRQPAARGRN